MSSNGSILIAGGAGFVGSAIVQRALETTNLDLVVVDNLLHGARAHVPKHARIRFVLADGRDVGSLAAAMRGVQYVISCIGDTFVPAAYSMAARFFDNNLRANLGILEACRLVGIERLVYASTTEVYDAAAASVIDERTPLSAVNTYAVSKLAADQLMQSYHREHGVPVVVARLFNAYGPRETHPYVIPEIISQLHREGSSLKLGNVDAERDFTFVDDTADALLALATDARVEVGGVFNVGSGSCVSIATLARLIAEIMDIAQPKILLDEGRLRRCEIPRFCCDATRLRMTIGWQPRVALREGLARTIRWFRDNGDHWPFERREHPEIHV